MTTKAEDVWPVFPLGSIKTLEDNPTLREYFATHAPPMPARWDGVDLLGYLDGVVAWNFAYADRMLAQRNK